MPSDSESRAVSVILQLYCFVDEDSPRVAIQEFNTAVTPVLGGWGLN